MINKVRLWGGALLLTLAAQLAGCNHEKATRELPQPTETVGDAASNRELAAVAKALARMLQADAASQQALREEALKRLDGDYDVLYQPFATAHAAFGQQLATAMAATDAQELTMSDVLTRFPNLNLSVPVHIDRWDAATYAPWLFSSPLGSASALPGEYWPTTATGRSIGSMLRKRPIFRW